MSGRRTAPAVVAGVAAVGLLAGTAVWLARERGRLARRVDGLSAQVAALTTAAAHPPPAPAAAKAPDAEQAPPVRPAAVPAADATRRAAEAQAAEARRASKRAALRLDR